MSFKVKMACAATLLALGSAAHAERVIVSYDSNGQGLKKGHEVKVEGNGWFAVELDENGKSAIRGQKGFKSMETDFKRFPMAIYNDDAGDPTVQQLTPYAIYQSQANQLTLQAGQKVCVIDSGIAGDVGETGGKNYDFDWSVITGTSDSGTGDWFRDGGPHGTHVAGTVGAADNGFGVVGMAPGVPMHIIKVFNASGWGYSSDLAHAAEKCTEGGANIITMSLGGGGANSTEENAFNTFTANGGLVLAAAGNDGNTTRSYPAGYASVMMVGANDADNNIASFSQYPNCTVGRGGNATTDDGYCVEVTAGGVDTLSTYPAGGATIASAEIDGVGVAASGMENNGSASGDTYYMGLGSSTDAGANGKICVIDRGEISFHDKTANCENSGGLGAIIINNESGMLYGTLGDTNTTTIPVVGTALEDRNAILAAVTASVNIGPGDYGYMSGTSMATPGVAGVAALVWSNFPSCTGTEIRDALKATAEDQGAAGRDDYFGYGIVKAKHAYDYLLANGCAGGDTGGGDSAPVANFTYSCTDLSCTFTDGSSDDNGIASYSWTFGDGNSSTATNPSHSYAADGSYTVTLTVTDTAGQTDSSSQTVTVATGGDTGGGDLTASGYRSKGGGQLNIEWAGFTSTNVDINISANGTTVLDDTQVNDGYVAYSGADKKTTYTITVCESGTTTCAASFDL